MVGGVEHKVERHLDDPRYLARVGYELHRRLDPAHERLHQEAGHCEVWREAAQELDFAARQPDLLESLSKGRRGRAVVHLFNAAAREADLRGVDPEVGIPLCEDHARTVGMRKQPHQHSRRDTGSPERHSAGRSGGRRRTGVPQQQA